MSEFCKKYGWLVVLLPVAGYFLWVWWKEKRATSERMKEVRQAKELKNVPGD